VQQQQQLNAFRLYNCNFKPTLNLGAKSFYHRKASKLAVLNAQVDLNTDKVTLLTKGIIFKYQDY
jgi:hypothetical protein